MERLVAAPQREDPRREPFQRVPVDRPAALNLQESTGNRATTRWVQRLFVDQTTAVTPRKIATPAEVELLLKDAELHKLIAGRLGGPAEAEKAVPYALKKLSEGPDIPFRSTEELIGRIDQRLGEIAPTEGDEGASKSRRQLNRIAGQLQEKLGRLMSTETTAKLLTGQFGAIVDLAAGPALKNADDALLLKMCNGCSLALADLLSTGDARGMWVGYDAVSSFGPLGHAVITAAGGHDKAGPLNDLHLRNLEVLREVRGRADGDATERLRGRASRQRADEPHDGRADRAGRSAAHRPAGGELRGCLQGRARRDDARREGQEGPDAAAGRRRMRCVPVTGSRPDADPRGQRRRSS